MILGEQTFYMIHGTDFFLALLFINHGIEFQLVLLYTISYYTQISCLISLFTSIFSLFQTASGSDSNQSQLQQCTCSLSSYTLNPSGYKCQNLKTGFQHLQCTIKYLPLDCIHQHISKKVFHIISEHSI